MSIVLHGVAAGKGIAIGQAHLITRGTAEVPQYDVSDDLIDAETARFDAAIKATRKELEQLRSAIPENAPTELGAFISLHLMLLTDVTLSREPVDILKEQKINAEWALKQQSDKLAAQFDSIEDDYLRERKQDMLQVVRRIHNNLVGQSNDLNLTEGLFEDTILIAHDLSPADTVLFKEQRITAFVTDVGGPTSHTAILGRSLDIPSVIGLHNARRLITENETVIVDGINGVLIIDPDEVVLNEYRRLAREYRLHKRELNKLKKTAATTADGINIELLANIESAEDIKALHNFGDCEKDERQKHHHPHRRFGRGQKPPLVRSKFHPQRQPQPRARTHRHPPVPRRTRHVPHPNARHPPRRRPRSRAHDVADDYLLVRSAPMPYPPRHGPTPARRTRRNLRHGQRRLHD